MGLITKEIDETDPRYIDYLKTTDNPTWIGYQDYCGKLFDAEVNVNLKKYADRNEKFLIEIGHYDTIAWAQEYINSLNGMVSRDVVGNAVFNAQLTIMGNYNPLMMFLLPKEELEREEIILRLEKIAAQRVIIEKSLTNERA